MVVLVTMLLALFPFLAAAVVCAKVDLLVPTLLTLVPFPCPALARAQLGFPGDDAPCGISVLVGMCKAGFTGDTSSLISVPVASGTGTCRPGFSGDDAHHASFVPVVCGSGMFTTVFPGVDATRAVLRPNSGSGRCAAGFPGDDQLVQHFSGHCEFLTRLDDKFQALPS